MLIGEGAVRRLKRHIDRFGRLMTNCIASKAGLGAKQVNQGWVVVYCSYSANYVVLDWTGR